MKLHFLHFMCRSFWLLGLVLLLEGRVAYSQQYPSGFQESAVFTGLNKPTAVRFSSDGRIFITEKNGIIKIHSGLLDITPDIFVDLGNVVNSSWDRGLLGLALDPNFPTTPYVYVLYTFDFDPFVGTPPPYWNDACPDPPGLTNDGCVVNARVSRLQVGPDNTQVGTELILLENNWCQQFPSHSIGGLAFGPDGSLIVSAGDGASFNLVDYGQGGGDLGSPTPKNPCDDPPVPRGDDQIPPGAEGGALRSQDLRTPNDPQTYDGTIIRIDPNTGAAWPTNPLIGGNPDDDRVIAYGLRNPFRISVRPQTFEVWIGDVGWNSYEEIDKVGNPDAAPIANFGWPCYEGPATQAGYDVADLSICENLYAENSATPPFYAYQHEVDVDPLGDACNPENGSSITGISFYQLGVYPTQYEGALFFADYSRDCIYVVQKGSDGEPDLNTRTAFGAQLANPVDLQTGPGGDLFYLDHSGGRLFRIEYFVNNQPPVAVVQATPTAGHEPLNVQFDGSGSYDLDPGSSIFFAWDLDGDGQFDDSTTQKPAYLYTIPGIYTVGLLLTDDDGATDTDLLLITVGNQPPDATVVQPLTSLAWQVGDPINFSGSASDPEDGSIPPSSMQWEIILHHCTDGMQNCHSHSIQEFDGVDHGTFAAPDHGWYSYLEFKLTVTDSEGLTDQDSVYVDPLGVVLTFDTIPSGLQLSFGGSTVTAPFQQTVIVGSLNSVTAPSPLNQNSTFYYFEKWSDGGDQSHEITAGQNPTTYIASYHTLIYFDDFEDGDAFDWTPIKGLWSVQNGNLTGAYRKKADIISPFDGCVVCTIEANLQIDTPDAEVSLLAWYLDKHNTVEVRLQDSKDKIVLKHRSNGTIITKAKFDILIDPGIDYRVKLVYDGTRFLLYLNKVFLLETIAVQPPNNGTVGLRLKSTTGQDANASFAEILVY